MECSGQLQEPCKLEIKVWISWKWNLSLNTVLCPPSSFRALKELKGHQFNSNPERTGSLNFNRTAWGDFITSDHIPSLGLRDPEAKATELALGLISMGGHCVNATHLAGTCMCCAQVVSAILSGIVLRESPLKGILGTVRWLSSTRNDSHSGGSGWTSAEKHRLTANSMEIEEVSHYKVAEGNHFISHWQRSWQVLLCRRKWNFFKCTDSSPSKCLPQLQPLTSICTYSKLCQAPDSISCTHHDHQYPFHQPTISKFL